MMMKSIPLLAVTILLAFGCSSPSKQQAADPEVRPGMVNNACPMSARPLTADSPTSDWNGVTLGFCGPGCKAAFDRQTPAEKTREVANLESGREQVTRNGRITEFCPMSSRTLTSTSPTSTWDGVTVGFCCNGCKSRFDDMTAAEKDAMIARLGTST